MDRRAAQGDPGIISRAGKMDAKADENVRKQREQADALKDLTEAARKFRDEATLTTETAGMSDRQRSRFDETQQIDRVLLKRTAVPRPSRSAPQPSMLWIRNTRL